MTIDLPWPNSSTERLTKWSFTVKPNVANTGPPQDHTVHVNLETEFWKPADTERYTALLSPRVLGLLHCFYVFQNIT